MSSYTGFAIHGLWRLTASVVQRDGLNAEEMDSFNSLHKTHSRAIVRISGDMVTWHHAWVPASGWFEHYIQEVVRKQFPRVQGSFEKSICRGSSLGHSPPGMSDWSTEPYTGVLRSGVVEQVCKGMLPPFPHPLSLPLQALRLNVLTHLDPPSYAQLSGSDRRLNVLCDSESTWQILLHSWPWLSDRTNATSRSASRPTSRQSVIARWPMEVIEQRLAKVQQDIASEDLEEQQRLSQCETQWASAMISQGLVYIALIFAICATRMPSHAVRFTGWFDPVCAIAVDIVVALIGIGLVLAMFFLKRDEEMEAIRSEFRLRKGSLKAKEDSLQASKRKLAEGGFARTASTTSCTIS